MFKVKKIVKKIVAVAASCVCLVVPISSYSSVFSETVNVNMDWGMMEISGGGFVSGIITGQKVMYARTDVGGAYKYDYDSKKWVQLMNFISEEDRGYLSIDALAIDPKNDDIIYILAGCAYFSGARTAVFKSVDGGKSFTEYEVTDLIQVHGNGYGRHCGESISVDPNNSNIIYCGGDTTGLIMSEDAGKTWSAVDSFNSLGLFTETIKWPTWTEHMVKATAKEYAASNGIATINITGGKVYVGTSVIGVTNMYVADVGEDNWKPISADLPKNLYPSRINLDSNGNLLISYVPDLTFGKSGGGAYRYDVKTGAVTNISPLANTPIGSVTSDKNDANKLVATSCGLWNAQLWDKNAWETETVAWGDMTFKSLDGGKTWTQMAPGSAISWGGELQANYLQNGGVSWVENKAIHWSGNLVIDPNNSDKVLITSGNGVFACDDIWAPIPTFYFHAKGIEEVVALDLVSVPGGDVYSAIGDYDGFVHKAVDQPGIQHQPNMGSTSAIAYCPSNPKVMVRFSMNEAKGYYTTDGGTTWISMKIQQSGQKAAITEISTGMYRIFCGKAYTDDFGATWSDVTGITTSSSLHMQVDPKNPKYVYAAGNDNNPYDPNWKANNFLFVSSDYGKTFTRNTMVAYDKAEDYARICAAGNGLVYAPTGYMGLYVSKDYGSTTTKVKGVDACFSVGVGAAKDSKSPLAIYIWGQANGTGKTGIYMSADGGETWTRINDDNNQFGGPGNGKFIVGDMNTFGTVYMSTVGMGIVYGQISNSTPAILGDIDGNGSVTIVDMVLMIKYMLNTTKFTTTQEKSADLNKDGNINIVDVVMLKKILLS